MIRFNEKIAWVRGTDGRSRPFDGSRLIASLQAALASEGGLEPLVGDAIVGAIHQYLCEACPERTISSIDIEDMVFSLLMALGLEERACAYRLRGLRTIISLDNMAVGADFELGFYQRLTSALRTAVDGELELVQLFGLRACVMRLLGAKRWGANCRSLADEIVGFVRIQIDKARPHTAAAVCVEVTE